MTNLSKKSYLNYIIDSGINTFLQDSPNNFFIEDNKLIKSKNIEDISNIAELEKYIKNSKIYISKNSQYNSYLHEGDVNSKIMIIGQSPKIENYNIIKPILGSEKELLSKMLAAINLNLNSIFFINAIPYFNSKNNVPQTLDILECLSFIQKYY